MPTAKTVYVTKDNRMFPTLEEAKSHEREHFVALLVELKVEEVEAALAGRNDDLAEAIERAAYLISKRRREAGDLKRRPREATTEEGAPAVPAQDEAA